MVGSLLCGHGPSFWHQVPPYIFTYFADLVEWIAKQNYHVTFLMHYLDDFHTLGPPGSPVCQHNLDTPSIAFLSWAFPYTRTS